MTPKLRTKTLEALAAVLPISGIVLAISIILVPVDTGTAVMFLIGSVMLVVGMGLFQLGADISMSPLGEGIGVKMSKLRSLALIAFITFITGVIVTIAEPDLQVLAGQVPSVPNPVLIGTVAVGVGFFLVIAVLRIYLKISLSILLIGTYILLLALSFIVPRDFIAVAFDSGGVTTGPITVPFIMAMGIGLASVRGDKSAVDDSFGLVALSSGGPILAVLILGCIYTPHGNAGTSAEVIPAQTMNEAVGRFVSELPDYAAEVAISIAPILAVFVILQLITRRFKRMQIFRMLLGFVYTYAGLVLFLCGVNIGFAPVGTVIGREIAAIDANWLLVPIGMMIGFFIVKAEPAIQILNKQVKNVTEGAISEKAMNRCLSIGVAVSVGLSMLRILAGIPMLWIIVPGYTIALVMSLFVPKIFVGIAFDSGGVASGPMTTTFLLPLSIGACETIGGNLMTDAFGVVALVALTPLIAVQIMGLRYRFKLRKLRAFSDAKALVPADSDEIIDLREDIHNELS